MFDTIISITVCQPPQPITAQYQTPPHTRNSISFTGTRLRLSPPAFLLAHILDFSYAVLLPCAAKVSRLPEGLRAHDLCVCAFMPARGGTQRPRRHGRNTTATLPCSEEDGDASRRTGGWPTVCAEVNMYYTSLLILTEENPRYRQVITASRNMFNTEGALCTWTDFRTFTPGKQTHHIDRLAAALESFGLHSNSHISPFVCNQQVMHAS